jgi:hypothetical protein
MCGVEERIRQHGIVLPAVFEGRSPRAVTFKLVKVAGDVAYVSGHGPMDGQRALMTGKVGDDRAGDWLSQEAGYEAARPTALSITASLKAELGDLDRVSAG